VNNISNFLITGLLCLLAACSIFTQKNARYSNRISKENTRAIMKKVCDWQLRQKRRHRNDDWTRATLYAGVIATYHATKDRKYLDAAMEWAEENEWKLYKDGIVGRARANEQGAGQTYLELYFIKKDPEMIANLRSSLNRVIVDSKPGIEEWWWCDALFMSPPTLTWLSFATKDSKYLDYMNTMWWANTEAFYDSEEHLFYRDINFVIKPDGSGRRTKSGKKIFWGRGNGWVMGGIVRVLQLMPEDFPNREKYIRLCREMSAKIASLQGKDGLWRVSLLDPDEYPAPETSCSGFFCYALAWGINHGILDKEQYLPVVEKSWKGLVSSVDKSGKLGWVQKIAHEPETISRDDTEVYGVGAFLLAGSEVVKLGR